VGEGPAETLEVVVIDYMEFLIPPLRPTKRIVSIDILGYDELETAAFEMQSILVGEMSTFLAFDYNG